MSKRKRGRTPQTRKYSGVANPRYAREMHELRSSNAAGPHGAHKTEREAWRRQVQRGIMAEDD